MELIAETPKGVLTLDLAPQRWLVVDFLMAFLRNLLVTTNDSCEVILADGAGGGIAASLPDTEMDHPKDEQHVYDEEKDNGKKVTLSGRAFWAPTPNCTWRGCRCACLAVMARWTLEGDHSLLFSRAVPSSLADDGLKRTHANIDAIQFAVDAP